MAEPRLVPIAEELLDGIVAAAADYAVTLPERRIIAEGQVSWDCPLVAVALPRVFRGRPTAAAGARNRPADTYTGDYRLWIIREVPVPSEDGARLPSADEITAAAKALLVDAEILTLGMRPTLGGLAGRCTAIAAGEATSHGPEGGLAAYSAVVEVGL